jgi:hypothetical protein
LTFYENTGIYALIRIRTLLNPLYKLQEKPLIKSGYTKKGIYKLFLVVIVIMTEEKLINTIYLENDLILSFCDGSKKIAGDRWQVNVTARIQILMDQVQFTRLDSKKRSEIIKEIGKKINYEKKLIRNFVAEKQKEETVTALCESFLQIARPYLSQGQFAERFVLKTYADSLEKRKWVNS